MDGAAGRSRSDARGDQGGAAAGHQIHRPRARDREGFEAWLPGKGRTEAMDDLLSEFLTETNESLAELDVELVKLEQNPNDKELLDNIFRLMPTIKGTCGFLGLPRLDSVAHAGANALGKGNGRGAWRGRG